MIPRVFVFGRNTVFRNFFPLLANKVSKSVELAEKDTKESIEIFKDIFNVIERKNELSKAVDRKDLSEEERSFFRNVLMEAIDMYLIRYGRTRRGHIQFINQCLQKSKEYGIADELAVYKKIIEIFQEEIYIPTTILQLEYDYFPLQQDTCAKIISSMNDNHVVPDDEFAQLLYKRFGLYSSPMTKLMRTMYWVPKTRNINPWPKPERVPLDPIEIAKCTIERMKIEKNTSVTTHEVRLRNNDDEKSWIVSSQSKTQRALIKYYYKKQKHLAESANDLSVRTLFVDGPYVSWMRHKRIEYYTLSTDIDKDRMESEEKFMKSFNDYQGYHDSWYSIFGRNTEFPKYFGDSTALDDSVVLTNRLNRYESQLENCTLLATCIPKGADISLELKSWISSLLLENPELHFMKLVFRVPFSDLNDSKK